MSAVPGPPGQPSQPGQGQQPSAVTPASPGVPPGVPAPYQHKTPWTAYIKPVIWTLVAIYAVGFVFLNTTTISINFVFFRAEVALIFVLVGMALIGAGLCAGVMIRFADEELTGLGPRQEAARRRLLETALGYYQQFIELRKDDPTKKAELAEAKAKLAANGKSK